MIQTYIDIIAIRGRDVQLNAPTMQNLETMSRTMQIMADDTFDKTDTDRFDLALTPAS